MNERNNDDLIEKAGGRFKFTVLVQKRLRELVKGADKLAAVDNKNLIDTVLQEIREGKIKISSDDAEHAQALKQLVSEKKGVKKAKDE